MAWRREKSLSAVRTLQVACGIFSRSFPMPTKSDDAAPMKPSTHTVYFVSQGAGDTEVWDEIGVAWSHSDGEGLDVRLEPFPREIQGTIIIRVNQPDAGSQEETTQ